MDFNFINVDSIRRAEQRNDNIMSRQDTWLNKLIDCVAYGVVMVPCVIVIAWFVIHGFGRYSV